MRRDESEREQKANELAGSWLLGHPIPSPPARLGGAWVERVAEENGVAPIVIVGQLQNMGVLDWRTSLARNALTATAAPESWAAEAQLAG